MYLIFLHIYILIFIIDHKSLSKTKRRKIRLKLLYNLLKIFQLNIF